MKILQLILDTIFHLLKMFGSILPRYKVAKLNVNWKPDSMVIGPACRANLHGTPPLAANGGGEGVHAVRLGRKRVNKLSTRGMWLAREPGAGSGERGAGIKRVGSRDCRKKSRNR
jgi:hypothetical protein